MEVRNCKSCGRLFNYLSGPPICEVCRSALETKFEAVRDYIRDNPKATMQDICDANDVTIQQLKQWVREERLQFAKDSPIGIECEICGASIRTGRYCDKCKENTANSFASQIRRPAAPQPEVKKNSTTNKMRFI